MSSAALELESVYKWERIKVVKFNCPCRDISVSFYFLMSLSDEIKLIQDLSGFPNNRMWKIPIHYVDIPGIVPENPLPIEAIYGDWKNVWTYMALIGQKVCLILTFSASLY